ncbi:MAG: hypothetical protein MUE52_05435 [Tabrizicola sp.]|jgi:hypothetical protein|nr:hypothetical protein [Tabrizicola sp.]
MRFVLCVAATLLAGHAASAEDCLVCDPEIVMTPPLAACFLDGVTAALAEMDRTALPYHLVNLGNCPEVLSGTRGYDETADSLRQIMSWSQIRNARDSTPTVPSTTFILDRAGILCLAEAIRSDPLAFTPAAAFRPAEMCQP